MAKKKSAFSGSKMRGPTYKEMALEVVALRCSAAGWKQNYEGVKRQLQDQKAYTAKLQKDIEALTELNANLNKDLELERRRYDTVEAQAQSQKTQIGVLRSSLGSAREESEKRRQMIERLQREADDNEARMKGAALLLKFYS